MKRRAFFGWPGWWHVGYAAVLSTFTNVVFLIVYFGADAITSRRAHHFDLYFAGELAMPFRPEMVVVYDSLYLLFLAAPFVLRSRAQLREFATSIGVATVIAGAIFILIPARLGFPPHSVSGPFRTMFEVTDRLNLDFNLVPSLHVTFALICVRAYGRDASKAARAVLLAWAVALIASTLLTHQHHLIDGVAGAALAWAVYPLRTIRDIGLLRRTAHVE